MPDFSALVGAFGPVGALIAYMALQSRSVEKSDPFKTITADITEMRERMVRVETMLEHLTKKTGG